MFIFVNVVEYLVFVNFFNEFCWKVMLLYDIIVVVSVIYSLSLY